MSAGRLVGAVLVGGAVVVIARGGLGGLSLGGSTEPRRLAPEPERRDWRDDVRDAAVEWGTDRLGGWLDGLIGGGSDDTDRRYDRAPPPAAGGGGWDLGDLVADVGSTGSTGGADTSTRGTTRPLLSLIGRLEAPAGYDQVYGGTVIDPPRPITTMSVREVHDWQGRNQRAGAVSTAAGRYQVIRGTLADIVRAGDLSWSERYDRDAQERAALSRMRYRGLDRYRAGRLTDRQFGQRLAQEWAALPAQTVDQHGRTAAGQSYWSGTAGNRARTDRETVLRAVRRI